MLTGCVGTAAGVTKGTLDFMFEDKPPKLVANIQASADVNPDTEGSPSPVVIRIYELNSLAEFNAADFFALYDNDTDVLAEELILREEKTLLPSEGFLIERELNIATRYVGIIVAYQDIENAKWRASFETPVSKKTKVDIIVNDLKIDIKNLK